MNSAFTEEDKNRVIELLNFIAKRAQFPNWTTDDTVKHFKLLAHMQQVVLPKIEAHILEVKEVVQAENKDSEEV